MIIPVERVTFGEFREGDVVTGTPYTVEEYMGFLSCYPIHEQAMRDFFLMWSICPAGFVTATTIPVTQISRFTKLTPEQRKELLKKMADIEFDPTIHPLAFGLYKVAVYDRLFVQLLAQEGFVHRRPFSREKLLSKTETK